MKKWLPYIVERIHTSICHFDRFIQCNKRSLQRRQPYKILHKGQEKIRQKYGACTYERQGHADSRQMPATCNLNKFVPLLDARLNLRCTSGQAHSFFLKTSHFNSHVPRPRLRMLWQQITKRSCTLANKAFSTDLFSLLICNLLENRQSDTCDVILRRNHRFITT